MTNDEVLNLPGDNNPTLLADGMMGMLIQYPRAGGQCGIQVHGEDDIRWIDSSDLIATPAGALRQAGSPMSPKPSDDPAQRLLALDWKMRSRT